jgi:predicted metallo-beta-lactamase superfamily hydrolase
MQEEVLIEIIEKIDEVYRGRVVTAKHPTARRANSQVRTASFHAVGDIIELHESWLT